MKNDNETIIILTFIITAAVMFNYGFFAGIVTLVVLSYLHTIERMLIALTMNPQKVDCKSTESAHTLPDTATKQETSKQESPKKKRWLSMSNF